MGDTRVIRIPLRVANSYLVIGRRTIIVDTGDPGYSQRILNAVQTNDLKKSDITMIFLTHGHIDHFGSVYELKRLLDVPVAIQRIDEPYLLEGIQAPLYPRNAAARLIKAVGKNMQVKKRYDLQAELVFDDELDLQDFGVDARLISTPGHTLGSASLVLPDGIAMVGDLLIHKHFLFGEPCPPPFLHDEGKHTESMRKLIDMGVVKFLPGHGQAICLPEIQPRYVL